MKLNSMMFVLAFLFGIHHVNAAENTSSTLCPTGFTQSTVSVVGGTKVCCEFKKEQICPPNNEQFTYEFSQDCGPVAPNTASLKYCCIKKPKPFVCKEPNQLVVMSEDECKKLAGAWNPQTKQCCLGCRTIPPAGSWTVSPITNGADCKTPMLYIPSSPGNMNNGLCCRKLGN